jgi:Voltage gated chloride channel
MTIRCALLTGLVYGFEDLFYKIPIHWAWWPAIGGLAVGVAGYLDPRILGVGYVIEALLNGKMIGTALWLLLILKSLAWSISLGSGGRSSVLTALLRQIESEKVREAGWLAGFRGKRGKARAKISPAPKLGTIPWHGILTPLEWCESETRISLTELLRSYKTLYLFRYAPLTNSASQPIHDKRPGAALTFAKMPA